MTRSYADAFPLTPAGGLFLTVIGAFIILGSRFFGSKNVFLGIGGGLGIAAAFVFGGYLSEGHGIPTAFQIWSIIVAGVLEGAAMPFIAIRLRPQGPRVHMLGVLVAVGAHFFIMIPAFGPVIAMLGCLLIGNAALGWNRPAEPNHRIWLADGLIKTGVGLLMWLGAAHLPAGGF